MTNTSSSSHRSEVQQVGRRTRRPSAAAAALPSLSVVDAMSFFLMVKEAFQERHPDKYSLFIRVMRDFKNQEISVAVVASTAKVLFQDNPDLALRFNAFLPEGHWIQVGLDELTACLIKGVNLDDDGSGGGH